MLNIVFFNSICFLLLATPSTSRIFISQCLSYLFVFSCSLSLLSRNASENLLKICRLRLFAYIEEFILLCKKRRLRFFFVASSHTREANFASMPWALPTVRGPSMWWCGGKRNKKNWWKRKLMRKSRGKILKSLWEVWETFSFSLDSYSLLLILMCEERCSFLWRR